MARVPAEIPITARVVVPGDEIELSFARSGGPGGQHVNKTASKVVLRWSLRGSTALGDADRAWLETRLAARLTSEGDLLVTSDVHRDQRRNVEDVLARFVEIVQNGLRRPKRRKKTKPSRASQERRLASKRRRSDVKRDRRRPTRE